MALSPLTIYVALCLLLAGVLLARTPLASAQAGPEHDSFLRWGYYVPWAADSLESLRRNLPHLDIVALHWASIDEKAVLRVEGNPEVDRVLEGFEGKVLTDVMNRNFDQDVVHTILTDSEVRERALEELSRVGAARDGLVLDFEDIAPADRAAYSSFIRDLRAKLPPEKLLAVAVPARTQDTGVGWAGAYDYQALGESADLIFLMAYAFRTAFSPTAGPTAPLPWIEASVEHALASIPGEKLVLGLPAFGYDWPLQREEDDYAVSVTYTSALQIARDNGQLPLYDWFTSGAYFRYQQEEREHEVWFEDAQTFDQKLALVHRYGLGGVGWWRLGGEDPAAWSALAARWSGGRFFPETGYAITNSRFLEYFDRRGDVRFFGYPVSNEFLLLGTRVQLFQRAGMQISPDGGVQLLNLLDDLMPLQQVNFSTLPLASSELQAEAPGVDAPDYAEQLIPWIRSVVPDEFEGEPVGFQRAFFGSIDCERAYPDEPCREELLPLLAVELWGLPTSPPTHDPNNSNFIYQRFQRGVLHYDATLGVAQGLLVGDYAKSVLTGRHLPLDLEEDLAGSALFRQYLADAPLGLTRPDQLPASNFTGAFLVEP